MISLAELKQRIATHPFFSSPFYLKHRHFVVPGVVLGVAILISALVTIPQFFKLFETFKNIEDLNQKRDFLVSKKETLAGMDLELYRKNLDTALIALPVEKDIPGVTGEMLIALSGSGMTLVGISFSGSPSETAEVQEYSLKFEVTGQESNLKNFLERVKVSPRIIKLTSLEVGKGRTSTLSATITFVTLYQQLPADIGTVEDKIPELTPEDNKVLAEIEQKIQAIPQIDSQSGAQPVDGKINPFTR